MWNMSHRTQFEFPHQKEKWKKNAKCHLACFKKMVGPRCSYCQVTWMTTGRFQTAVTLKGECIYRTPSVESYCPHYCLHLLHVLLWACFFCHRPSSYLCIDHLNFIEHSIHALNMLVDILSFTRMSQIYIGDISSNLQSVRWELWIYFPVCCDRYILLIYPQYFVHQPFWFVIVKGGSLWPTGDHTH